MRKSTNGTDRGRRRSSGTGIEIARPQVPPVPERPVRTISAGIAKSGHKSLMKTSGLATAGGVSGRRSVPVPMLAPAIKARKRPSASAGAGDRNKKIEERIGAASEELASGIIEAASAAEELRRAMEQIASGAEEAACRLTRNPCRRQ